MYGTWHDRGCARGQGLLGLRTSSRPGPFDGAHGECPYNTGTPPSCTVRDQRPATSSSFPRAPAPVFFYRARSLALTLNAPFTRSA